MPQTRISSREIGDSEVNLQDIADSSITESKIAAANKDGSAATPSMRTLGSGSLQAVSGSDARLSNSRTPLSHVHGNILNGGTIGSTANLPLITGAGGIIQVGAFGTGENNFTRGNDSRLSNARTPSNDSNLVHRTGDETIDGLKTFLAAAVFNSSVTAKNAIFNNSGLPGNPLTIYSGSGANGLKIIGRSDNLGYIEFVNNDATTVNSSINGSSNGLEFTGAAKFSSSVTADKYIFSNAMGIGSASANEITLFGFSTTTLKIDLGSSNTAIIQTSLSAITFANNISASNLSGTNTGDQNLSGYVTLAGSQTITGSKTFEVNTFFNSTTLWVVSSSDSAHQRADCRDESTNFSRLHWYGVSDTGGTSNYRHAWFDGSSYINVTASGGFVSFSAGVSATTFSGSGSSLTALNASNLSSGTVPDARISGSYTGLTNLTGSGSVDFSKFLGLAADTAASPSFTWTGDLTTGFYRPTTSQIGVSIAGTLRGSFSSFGLVITGTLQADTLTGTLNVNNLSGIVSAGNGGTGVTTGLSSLNADNLTSGTLPNSRLSGSYSGLNSLTANTFIKSGGTGAQYLMADGSVTTSSSGGVSSFTHTTASLNTASYNYNQSGIATTGVNTSTYNILDIRAMLQCKTANNGYSVGDLVSVLNGQYPIDSGRTAGQGITIQGISSSGVITYAIGEQFTIGVKRSGSGQTNAYFLANSSQWNLRFVVFFS